MIAEKHFEFTGETKVFCGITLKRIRASISFGTIVKGDVGGWVEKESNLSGNAWVSDNAQVSGNAQVYGDAQVSDNAQVSGNAQVYGDACIYGNAHASSNAQVYGDACVYGNAHASGNACVSGDAWIYDDAQVSGDAWIYGNARVFGDAQVSDNARVYGDAWEKSPLHINLTKWSLTVSTKTTITIGCNSFTVQEWEEKADDIAKKEHMTENEIKEYKMAIQYAKNWMKIYCK